MCITTLKLYNELDVFLFLLLYNADHLQTLHNYYYYTMPIICKPYNPLRSSKCLV